MFTQTALLKNIFNSQCTLGHQSLGLCEISDIYLPTRVFDVGEEMKKESQRKYIPSSPLDTQLTKSIVKRLEWWVTE